MSDSSPHSNPVRSQIPKGVDPDLYARLKAESKAPYRGLRQFIYIALGGSGFIGAVVFLSQVLAGRDLTTTFPNLLLQVGVVALMVWLYRLEERVKAKQGQPRR